MANTNENVNDAASVILTAELNALKSLQEVFDAFDAELTAIAATVPSTLNMDAIRIINEMRGTMSYRRSTELPLLVQRYEPVQPLTPLLPLA